MSNDGDLGFTYARAGDLYLIKRGRLTAATLRGRSASSFEGKIEDLDFAAQQRLMAKLTGNYKRGNERSKRCAAGNDD